MSLELPTLKNSPPNCRHFDNGQCLHPDKPNGDAPNIMACKRCKSANKIDPSKRVVYFISSTLTDEQIIAQWEARPEKGFAIPRERKNPSQPGNASATHAPARNDGNAREWGPLLWRDAHQSALYSPPHEFPHFMASIRRQIPCGACAGSYDRFCAKFPPPCGPAIANHRWAVSLHNEVNRSLGRREWTDRESFKAWRFPFRADPFTIDELLAA